MNATSPSVTVFAPSAHLTVTVEQAACGGDEVHLHAGGQGLWTSRTVLRLGEEPVLCTSTGGEPGSVLEVLVAKEGIRMLPVRVSTPTATYVHDRRSGDRQTVAETSPSRLDRHELDNLYEAVLASVADTGMLVLTGTPNTSRVPPSLYRRLGADLSSLGTRVVADIHGEELSEYLEHGRLELLKVSHEDLADDGIDASSPELAFEVIGELLARGVDQVVVSRGAESALAVMHARRLEAITPAVAACDHRGSGDAMTGAFAVGALRGLGDEQLLALGCGAGAASATRHGLATASAPLIAEFAHLTRVRDIA